MLGRPDQGTNRTVQQGVFGLEGLSTIVEVLIYFD